MSHDVEGISLVVELSHATIPPLKSALLILIGIACLTACPALIADPTPAIEPTDTDNTPCTIIEKTPPRFPTRMLKDGAAHGIVKMLLHVSSTGELTDTLVTAFTRKPFADEALHAVGKWKFNPGKAKGEPIDTIINLTFPIRGEGSPARAEILP